MKTIIFALIIFSAVIAIPLGLLLSHHFATNQLDAGLKAFEEQKIKTEKSALVIRNASYEKYPTRTITLYAKNTGMHGLPITELTLYESTTRINPNELIRTILYDIKNPAMLDPAETIKVTAPTTLPTNTTTTLTLSGRYGVQDTIQLSTFLAPLLLRTNPNPITLDENSSSVKLFITLYNQLDQPLTITSVQDIWETSQPAAVGITSCSPSPCTILQEKIQWNSPLQLAPDSALVLSSIVQPNGTTAFFANRSITIAYASKTTTIEMKEILFSPDAATAQLSIATTGFGYGAALGPLNSTQNRTFTLRIEETGKRSALNPSTTIRFRIPQGIVTYGTNDPKASTNTTHYICTLPTALKDTYTTCTFWAVLTNATMPTTIKAAVEGTDEEGNQQKGTFWLLLQGSADP